MASYTSVDRYVLTANRKFAEAKTKRSVQFYVYMAREHDSFERIAAIVLNDPTRYWEIADINPHVEWPDRIPAGTSIRIPL